MEGTVNYSLCILCCYSFPNSPQPGRKGNRTKKFKLVDKFIKQTGGELMKGLSSAGLLNQPDMSLCGECLSVVTKAAEKREQVEEVEVEVRHLQQEILGMLRKLRGLMDDYLEEMGSIENTIRCSDENCLRAKFRRKQRLKGVGKVWQMENVYQFRNEILNAAKEWSTFRNELPSTHMTTPSEQTDAKVECKVEEENENDQCGDQEPEPPMQLDNPVTFEKDPLDPLQDEQLPPVTTQELSSIDKPSTSANQLSTESSNWSNPANLDKPLPCPKCKKVLPSADRLKLHLLKKHTLLSTSKPLKKIRPKVKCSDCGEHVLPHNLFDHKTQCLALQPNWSNSCAHCFETFDSASTLTRHLSHAHVVPLPKPVFTCDVCGKTVTTVYSLESHKKLHLPPEERPSEEPVPCENCGKVLKGKRSYQAHIRDTCPAIAVLKNCVCDKCGKSFSRTGLLKHMRGTNCGGVVIVRGNFPCKYCGKNYSAKHLLKIHEKRHLTVNKRLFMCKLCGGDFNCLNHLKRHEKRCDGSKKPRRPRWSNMVSSVDVNKPEEETGPEKTTALKITN